MKEKYETDRNRAKTPDIQEIVEKSRELNRLFKAERERAFTLRELKVTDWELEQFGRFLQFGRAGLPCMDRELLFSIHLWRMMQMDDPRESGRNPYFYQIPHTEELWGFFCYCRHCRAEENAGEGLVGASIAAAFFLLKNQSDPSARIGAGVPLSLIRYDWYRYGEHRFTHSEDPLLFLYLFAEGLLLLEKRDISRRVLILPDRVVLCCGKAETPNALFSEAKRLFAALSVRLRHGADRDVIVSVQG